MKRKNWLDKHGVTVLFKILQQYLQKIFVINICIAENNNELHKIIVDDNK